MNCASKFVTIRLSFQHYDCLIGIGGGIGFTPFMSILKDFMAAKRQLRSNGDAKSSGYLALFYGVCRNLNDVAWWSSLSTEPDFSDFVSSCSVAIGADPRFASVRDSKAPRPSNIISQSRKNPHTSIRLSNVDKRVSVNLGNASLGSDMSKGLLGITLFCTGASEEQILAAKAVAAPGVSVRPGRPLFEKIFKCVPVAVEVNHKPLMIHCAGTWTERFRNQVALACLCAAVTLSAIQLKMRQSLLPSPRVTISFSTRKYLGRSKGIICSRSSGCIFGSMGRLLNAEHVS
jgi:hypothetical protein